MAPDVYPVVTVGSQSGYDGYYRYIPSKPSLREELDNHRSDKDSQSSRYPLVVPVIYPSNDQQPQNGYNSSNFLSNRGIENSYRDRVDSSNYPLVMPVIYPQNPYADNSSSNSPSTGY